MTDPKKLTADDARALLSDHLEGSLDDDARRQVDALLARDPELAAEHRRLERTMNLLQDLPRPEGPADIVGRVRDRLADERRAAERRAQASGGSATVASLDHVAPVVPLGSSWRRWGGIEAAIWLAAAASIAVFIAVVGGDGEATGAAQDTHAAGLAGDAKAVATTLVAPGFPRYAVRELAAKAGMDTVVGDTYEGDRRAAARFVLALKELAVTRGVEISGFVPDAERVRIEVKAQ